MDLKNQFVAGFRVAATKVGLHQMLPVLVLVVGLSIVVLSASTWGSSNLHSAADEIRPSFPALATFLTPEVVHELGMALVVAAIATISVERARIAMFSKQLSDQVDAKLAALEEMTTDAIMRGPLPRSYYEHVKRLSLLSQMHRTRWRVTLSYKHAGDGLNLIMDQEYLVSNMAGIELNFDLEHSETPDSTGDFDGSARIRYTRVRREGSSEWLLREEAPLGESLGTLEGESLTFKKTLSLKTGDTIVIESGSEERVRVADARVFTVSEPTTGVTFVCYHPIDVAVSVDFPGVWGVSSPVSFDVSKERMDADTARSEWHFPYPMIPSSAVVLGWWPVRRPSTTSPSQKT